LGINVIAKIVLALVFNDALNAVCVVYVVVDARGERLAIGVGGAREGQTGRVQLITERGVISGGR